MCKPDRDLFTKTQSVIEAKGASTLFWHEGGEIRRQSFILHWHFFLEVYFHFDFKEFSILYIAHDSLFKRNKRGKHQTSFFIGTVYGEDKACIWKLMLLWDPESGRLLTPMSGRNTPSVDVHSSSQTLHTSAKTWVSLSPLAGAPGRFGPKQADTRSVSSQRTSHS